MSDYVNLYTAILPGVLAFYDTTKTAVIYNPKTVTTIKGLTHIHHLLLIGMVLNNHQDKYKKSISDLSGINALHHMVFLKTHWKLEEIRSTPINDLLFVL